MKIIKFILSSTLCIISCADHDLQCSSNYDLFIRKTTLQLSWKEMVCNQDLGNGIAFHRLITDSRCPIDAYCIREGEVQVALNILQGEKVIGTLNMSIPGDPLEFEVNRQAYTFRLRDVNPYPGLGKSISLSDYNITLEIEPKEK